MEYAIKFILSLIVICKINHSHKEIYSILVKTQHRCSLNSRPSKICTTRTRPKPRLLIITLWRAAYSRSHRWQCELLRQLESVNRHKRWHPPASIAKQFSLDRRLRQGCMHLETTVLECQCLMAKISKVRYSKKLPDKTSKWIWVLELEIRPILPIGYQKIHRTNIPVI